MADESVFHAIASPTRRALLDALVLGETTVSELVASLDVTQSAVSQQLAILKGAGLVQERSQGRFRHYRLLAEPLLDVDVWMAQYRSYLDRQLDALGRVLDAMAPSPEDPPSRPEAAKPKAAHPKAARNKGRSS